MERYLFNRAIRHALKMTTKDLGDLVEVTKQTISNYENGRRTGRPIERVIEIELDLAIQRCADDTIRQICERLKHQRDYES